MEICRPIYRLTLSTNDAVVKGNKRCGVQLVCYEQMTIDVN